VVAENRRVLRRLSRPEDLVAAGSRHAVLRAAAACERWIRRLIDVTVTTLERRDRQHLGREVAGDATRSNGDDSSDRSAGDHDEAGAAHDI
jgi:hypothetical protein